MSRRDGAMSWEPDPEFFQTCIRITINIKHFLVNQSVKILISDVHWPYRLQILETWIINLFHELPDLWIATRRHPTCIRGGGWLHQKGTKGKRTQRTRVFKWQERRVESVAILRAGPTISYLSFTSIHKAMTERTGLMKCEVLNIPENGNAFHSPLLSLKSPEENPNVSDPIEIWMPSPTAFDIPLFLHYSTTLNIRYKRQAIRDVGKFKEALRDRA